jgi:hypothetical protein
VHEAQLFEDFSYLMGEKDRKVNIVITAKGVYFPRGSKSENFQRISLERFPPG